MAFADAIATVLEVEGGYSDHPDDSGGRTRYGVTEAVARRYGYTGQMAELPLAFAKTVYQKEYWDALNLDAVSRVAPTLAVRLFDAAVNCGPRRAGEWLQRSLNVLNRKAVDYPDLAVDGAIGHRTVYALRKFCELRPDAETILLRAVISLQGSHYITLAERREKDESFIYGWLRTRIN